MTANFSSLVSGGCAPTDYPYAYRLLAVVEEITAGWNHDQWEATAAQGMAEADHEAIAELLAEYPSLDLTSDAVEAMLLEGAHVRFPLAWLVEATAGTPGVNEGTFRWAVLTIDAAQNAEQAIELAGAHAWRWRDDQRSVFARLVRVPARAIGTEDEGAPGSLGTPEIS